MAKPKRSDYRKFKIRTVKGPDDYASMREILTRRFTHGMEESRELKEKDMPEEMGSFTKFPDLLMMDGGRGQVNIALQVLDELGLDIPVCGMVKDDNHRTRGLYYNNVELPIDRQLRRASGLITRASRTKPTASPLSTTVPFEAKNRYIPSWMTSRVSDRPEGRH